MKNQKLLDLHFILRNELLQSSEIAKLYNNAGLRRMAHQELIEVLKLHQTLTDMEQTILQPLQTLSLADLSNAVPSMEPEIMASFERHKAAGTLREWYFAELSQAERRLLELYTGGNL